MPAIPKNAALLLIDIQQGFDAAPYWGPRNNPQAESNAARLLAAWRASGRPLFHVQHRSTSPGSPLRPGQPGCDFKPEARPLPGEPVIGKNVNSAFIGTDLEPRLRGQGIDTVVIAGLTTAHCVSTTTRMAGNFGYETYLVSDATATFNKRGADGRNFDAELIHETALASLHGEFATVMTAESVGLKFGFQ